MSRIASLEDLELEKWLREREKGEIVWQTKWGSKIPISKMSDTHLINTINMIKRQAQIEEEQWEALSSIGDTIF